MSVPVTKGLSRVFIHKGGASPTTSPTFLAWAAAGALDKPLGDVTRIEAPSQVQRDAFDVIGSFRSGEENATLPLTIRYVLEKSEMLAIANAGCAFDLGIHLGKCTDPRDFNHGWKTGKILMLEDATLTTYGIGDLGTLTNEDQDAVNEEVELSALRVYEILPLTFAERAKSEVAQEIVKVLVCDGPSCGDCDDVSDGCQKVFAISAPVGSSPGLLPEVIVSIDGLSSVEHESPITTLTAAENPSDAACVGDYLVVVSQTDGGLHYADLGDLADGTETWTRVDTGIVATKEPNAISSVSPFDTYVAGQGGYIYFTNDPTSGVEVIDSGVATTENLTAIFAYSLSVIIAVGANNAVVFSLNGGDTFSSVTGPAAGVALTAVSARSEKEWWVGTATGRVFYTKDQGQHWTEKGFASSGSGSIEDIVWASNMVGYISHTLSSRGRVLRTVSGGHSWYVMPEGNGSVPAGDKFNSLAVCQREVNVLFAGGLADNAMDGILIKGSAS
jgi:photosystem II stability/assembly factor-like uncharacterized protein